MDELLKKSCKEVHEVAVWVQQNMFSGSGDPTVKALYTLAIIQNLPYVIGDIEEKEKVK